jgi:hypothetical protein
LHLLETMAAELRQVVAEDGGQVGRTDLARPWCTG